MLVPQRVHRPVIITLAFLLAWTAFSTLGHWPSYILPTPYLTWQALQQHAALLVEHTAVTLTETLLGLFVGSLTGMGFALASLAAPRLQRWLLPILVTSQAIPLIVLAPILVIWLGYGLFAKVTTTALMVFFPVTRSFLDGLQQTDPCLLELAHSVNAKPLLLLFKVRVPAAFPELASGLQIASVYAPMGAIISEWVGAEKGLGYLLLQANANLQTDLMFACVFVLVFLTLSLSVCMTWTCRCFLRPAK